MEENARLFAWGRIIPCPNTVWGRMTGSSFARGNIRVLEDKLTMLQQCILVAKQSNTSWAALGKVVPAEILVPLRLRAHLEGPDLGSPYKRDMDGLGQVQLS